MKQQRSNGADILCDVLLENDVNVCFANPGTSEMHFVAALDKKPALRCVLGLFEGVVTGAADGYARISGKPAATLLHLGSGLSNGLANLHNAKRARSPIVNIVGDHATYHSVYDAPLTSDILGIAKPVSHWLKKTNTADELSSDAHEAIQAAKQGPGYISTLILPADVAWSEVDKEAIQATPGKNIHNDSPLDEARIKSVAALLRQKGNRATLMLGGEALTGEALKLAGQISALTHVKLLAETFSKRLERGHGRTPITMLPYPIDQALEYLKEVEDLILIGAQEPVAFFAYPGKPSLLANKNSTVHHLAKPTENLLSTLQLLAQELGVGASAKLSPPPLPQPDLHIHTGKLTGQVICSLVAEHMPEHTILVDEAISQGRDFPRFSQLSAPHDYLQLTGGAIGIGIPMATGAAIASQEAARKVITLQADGSGMYTLQGLWTQARERLNCLTIIFANHSYASLHMEMKNVGASDLGRNALQMLDLVDPVLSWAQLAQGMGVESKRVTTIAEFKSVLVHALRHEGPFLIEAVV